MYGFTLIKILYNHLFKQDKDRSRNSVYCEIQHLLGHQIEIFPQCNTIIITPHTLVFILMYLSCV